jgi:hypothetical protein
MSEECKRVGRWIGGCKFEARHDEEPAYSLADLFDGCRATSEVARSLIAGNMKRAYVRDVCVRCGKTVERE